MDPLIPGSFHGAFDNRASSLVMLGYTAVVGPVLFAIGVIIYRLIFHPLASYPGPLLAKITGLYAVYHAYVGDVHLDMLRCHESYGPVVRYGPSKVIFNSSTAIKDIYSKSANVQKSTAYRAFETSSTAHDLQSTVDKVEHARKKRIIGQAFSESALRTLESHILPHIELLIQKLSPSPQEASADFTEQNWTEPKNVTNWANYVSFDFMTELVFGKALGMLKSMEHRYIIDLVQQAAFRVGVCLQMPLLSILHIDSVVAPKVKAYRNKYVETSKKMALDRIQIDSGRKDIFSHILAARDPNTGKGFSMDEIWGESTLLIIAGSDAISTAMAGCFFYLSRHRKAYNEVAREIRSSFATSDDIRMGKTISSCKYLRACIDESMRMSPPVGAALWREVLPGGTNIAGHFIPQGCDVGIGIYAIHHNPEYFPDPFLFEPERWIASENQSQGSIEAARTAFQAFSTGPVGCMGKGLAYMELSLTLARVIWELDFKTSTAGKTDMIPLNYLRFYKSHSDNEFLLRDRFTSWKDGPMLKFKKRTFQEQGRHT